MVHVELLDRFTPAQKKEFFPSASFGKEKVQVFDLKKDPGEKKTWRHDAFRGC